MCRGLAAALHQTSDCGIGSAPRNRVGGERRRYPDMPAKHDGPSAAPRNMVAFDRFSDWMARRYQAAIEATARALRRRLQTHWRILR